MTNIGSSDFSSPISVLYRNNGQCFLYLDEGTSDRRLGGWLPGNLPRGRAHDLLLEVEVDVLAALHGPGP